MACGLQPMQERPSDAGYMQLLRGFWVGCAMFASEDHGALDGVLLTQLHLTKQEGRLAFRYGESIWNAEDLDQYVV